MPPVVGRKKRVTKSGTRATIKPLHKLRPIISWMFDKQHVLMKLFGKGRPQKCTSLYTVTFIKHLWRRSHAMGESVDDLLGAISCTRHSMRGDFIHLLHLLSYTLCSIFVEHMPLAEALADEATYKLWIRTPLCKIAEAILDYSMRDNMARSHRMLAIMVTVTRDRHVINNINVEHFRQSTDAYTNMNRRLNKWRSHFVARQWDEAEHAVERPVYLSFTLPVRTAIYKLIEVKLSYLPTPVVQSIVRQVIDCDLAPAGKLVTEYNALEIRDILSLVDMMVTAGRERTVKRLIQVNRDGCTCQCKCFGRLLHPIFDYNDEDMRLHCFNIGPNTIMLCGRCRISPEVDDVTMIEGQKSFSSSTLKPRILCNKITPQLSQCAVCGTSVHKIAEYITMDVQRHEPSGHLITNYAHRYYTNNSTSMVEGLTQDKYTGTQSFMHGICYGGRRKCLTLHCKPVPSGKQLVNACKTSDKIKQLFQKETHQWTRCHECRVEFEQHSNMITMNDMIDTTNPLMHPNGDTCLHVYMQGMLEIVNICHGCKIAVLCPHYEVVARALGKHIRMASVRRRIFMYYALVRHLKMYGFRAK